MNIFFYHTKSCDWMTWPLHDVFLSQDSSGVVTSHQVIQPPNFLTAIGTIVSRHMPNPLPRSVRPPDHGQPEQKPSSAVGTAPFFLAKATIILPIRGATLASSLVSPCRPRRPTAGSRPHRVLASSKAKAPSVLT